MISLIILFDWYECVVIIMLNWFDQFNSFMVGMYWELCEVLDKVECQCVCVLILIGVGCSFCVGQDFFEFNVMFGQMMDLGQFIDE